MDARVKPGHDGLALSASFHLRAYRAEDEDASIALWLETWKLAYPSIDFDARVTIDSSGYLDQLVVAPDHWGSKLAGALVDEAKRRSPDGVTLKVNADNARAIRFYERSGFVHAGEDVNPGSKRLVLKMAWKP